MADEIIIVGGGPAGMMTGLLLARAGLSVTVLEKHTDFLRDFRGDTVHPSTLELIEELGWLDEFLTLPHNRVDRIQARIAGQMISVVDFRHLSVPAPYVAMMPQWDLLNFLARKATQYPGFTLRLGAESVGLSHDMAGRVSAVILADGEQIAARLVIAADGRRSVLRDHAALPLETIGAPIDVFWFRVSKTFTEDNETFGIFESGRIMVMIDRGEYWQCAFVIAKGQAEHIREAGLEAFKAMILKAEPRLLEGLKGITDFDDIKLLSVAIDRLTRWHTPGLLAIGDAAHAMSPVGGVGINLAIQDAVATANFLADPLLNGENPDPLLRKVQARRWRPTVMMQGLQRNAQDRLIAPLISGADIGKPPMPFRILNAVPLLQRIPARIIGLGFRREHIRSADINHRPD